ncbi:hypothetical protein MMC25_006106 [Agyrium rufum]|nr:hypothetical protein [Agyrium rufum]
MVRSETSSAIASTVREGDLLNLGESVPSSKDRDDEAVIAEVERTEDEKIKSQDTPLALDTPIDRQSLEVPAQDQTSVWKDIRELDVEAFLNDFISSPSDAVCSFYSEEDHTDSIAIKTSRLAGHSVHLDRIIPEIDSSKMRFERICVPKRIDFAAFKLLIAYIKNGKLVDAETCLRFIDSDSERMARIAERFGSLYIEAARHEVESAKRAVIELFDQIGLHRNFPVFCSTALRILFTVNSQYNQPALTYFMSKCLLGLDVEVLIRLTSFADAKSPQYRLVFDSIRQALEESQLETIARVAELQKLNEKFSIHASTFSAKQEAMNRDLYLSSSAPVDQGTTYRIKEENKSAIQEKVEYTLATMAAMRESLCLQVLELIIPVPPKTCQDSEAGTVVRPHSEVKSTPTPFSPEDAQDTEAESMIGFTTDSEIISGHDTSFKEHFEQDSLTDPIESPISTEEPVSSTVAPGSEMEAEMEENSSSMTESPSTGQYSLARESIHEGRLDLRRSSMDRI